MRFSVGLLLLVTGGVFGVLFFLNGMIQTARRRTKIGFTHLLLAFLTALLPLAGLIANELAQDARDVIQTGTLAMAGLTMGAAVVILLIEVRRPDRLKGSRGVLALGVGILIGVTAFSVPRISQRVLMPALATSTPIQVAAASSGTTTPGASTTGTRTPLTVTSTMTATPTANATATPTLRPTHSPTPTPTRFRFVTRTPEPTPTLPTPCLALTDYNVNLRAEPDMEGEILAVVSYNTTVALFGRSANSTWWFGEHDGQAGWLLGEFLSLSASCAELPVRQP
jgi:hypothetical protein